MAIDPSMEPMLEVFIYESTGLLEQLDEVLLESEKSKSLSMDNINAIFRIMHTIKGSAAMMDLTGISTLAHAVEDVFYILRENPDKLDDVVESIYDLVFQASDFLKEEVEAVQSTGEANKDPREIIRRLKEQAAMLNGEVMAHMGGAAASGTAVPREAPGGVAVMTRPAGAGRIRVFFEEGIQMENIRAFMLLSQLKDLCDELTSEPPNPESDSSLCNDIIKNGFVLTFRPAAGIGIEEIVHTIEGAVNIQSYEVLADGSAAPPAATPSVQERSCADQGKDRPAADADPPSSSGQQTAKSPIKQQSLVSVNQSKLDQLMDLVGELVTTESMVVNSPDLKGMKLDGFHKATRELRKLTDELQDVVMSIRMVPLSGTFQKMNRIVRDMNKKLGKQVELITLGGETEVDKTINDAIADPFMHMIRNAMDHAIEPDDERIALGKPEIGHITMEAKNVGGEIVITIADDGRGLSPESILRKARESGTLTKPESEYSDKEIWSLIMLPGFSTNREVTEFSGRGVGMDVVRKNIEKVSGTLSIDSAPGQGTTFTVKIPLTLAIVDGMELQVGDITFTLPITCIKQSFKISDDRQVLHNTDGTEMIMLRGECYPLIRLHRHFQLETSVTDLFEGIVIQIENDRSVACIFADELLGEQQVVVKPFPAYLNKYNIKQFGLSGCTILGDGNISLILDANSLLNTNN